jgi:hypothetical protein
VDAGERVGFHFVGEEDFGDAVEFDEGFHGIFDWGGWIFGLSEEA